MKLETVQELSKKLGVCKPTLYTQIRLGKIPAYKIGRKVLLNLDQVLQAMTIKPDEEK